MYPIARPYVTIRQLCALLNILKYRAQTVEDFENQFATSVGRAYACAFSGGRVAIQKVFEALEIKNQTVAMPSYTCLVVPYAVELSGNRPLFVEPKVGEFGTTAAALQAVAAISIPTHMFGKVRDQPVLSPNTLVIEDACLAFGSKIAGRAAGTLGDVSIFSFNRSKQLSCFGGGIAVTDRRDIYEKLKVFAQYHATFWDEVAQVFKSFFFWWFYRPSIYSFLKMFGSASANVTDFSLGDCSLDKSYSKSFLKSQAILGLGQLKNADVILAERRRIAAWYDANLRNFSDITIPRLTPDVELSHYWVLLKKPRAIVKERLFKEGIAVGVPNDYSCPLTAHYAANYNPADFSVSSALASSIISLPFYVGLTERAVRQICAKFKQVYESV
ncbi:MAG: DegT/DnrJ/EryC1/StrS family aminotransferase [Candidatus Magasanikbacteria bacterium]|nr:DegT/DnrJ/EryC1/StrS family aminotransferase [Candidatus Magasanikbacteria bacterium]